MKKLIKLSLLSSMILSSSVFALNPVLGFYGGLIAEGSQGISSTDFNLISSTGTVTMGQLKYNRLGGGGGLDLGYKFHNFRVEGELLYNTNSYNQLNINGCHLYTPNILTPVGDTCSAYPALANLGFEGSTTTIYGMVNGYFDIFTSDSESVLVPYVGLGIGRARFTNTTTLTNTVSLVSVETVNTSNASAAQAIVGVSYYMDDYVWASMDYRYLSTGPSTAFNNKRTGISTLNLSVNFAFSKG